MDQNLMPTQIESTVTNKLNIDLIQAIKDKLFTTPTDHSNIRELIWLITNKEVKKNTIT